MEHNDPKWIKERNSSRIRYIQQSTVGIFFEMFETSKPRVKNPKHLSRNCFGDSGMGQSKCALTARWKSQEEIVSWDFLLERLRHWENTHWKINRWNLKITCLKRKIIVQTFFFGFKMLIFRGLGEKKKCTLNVDQLEPENDDFQKESLFFLGAMFRLHVKLWEGF